MTKTTFTHRTESGHVSTRTSSHEYRFVTVCWFPEGIHSDPTPAWHVYSWHKAPPKSRAPYFTRQLVEAINGGER